MYVIDLHTMQKEESTVSPLSVALGNFDGVHIGHAKLISCAVEYAKKHGIKSAVWTFAGDSAVLPNKPDIHYITPLKEKLALIAELGTDYVILEDFASVRGYSPEKFVKELLIEKCGAVCAVCGFNFRFGEGGRGDSDALTKLMKPNDCIVVPPVFVEAETVSSTAVRSLIENGNMERAAKLLGRPFFIDMPVVDGKHLGRTIGIPTINQYFPNGHIIPKSGIYACTVTVNGKSYCGVANIGIRPTIKNDFHDINCETHIIGYDGWLYGTNVKVSFLHRLRDEIKFDSVEALKHQIESDIESALIYFENNKQF